jgi:ribosomal-protein-alanine N-acetyltransferase
MIYETNSLIVMKYKFEFNAENIDYASLRILNDLCFAHEPITRQMYQEYIADEFFALFTADAFIGFAAFIIRENRSHLRRIGIHPDFRARGLGGRLMERMLQRTKEQGVDFLDLWVEQGNQAAINLYQKFGYFITGESTQFLVPILSSDTEDFSVISVQQYLTRNPGLSDQSFFRKFADRHNPPQTYVLVFLQKDQPVGFTCFSPDLPGCYPFELFKQIEDIHQLISTLRPYLLAHKSTLKITTDDPLATTSLKADSMEENYRLYKMVRTLVSSG